MMTKDAPQSPTLFRERRSRCHRLLHCKLCFVSGPSCLTAFAIVPFLVDQEVIACNMAYTSRVAKLVCMRDLPMQRCLKAQAICNPVCKCATIHKDLSYLVRDGDTG